MKKIIALTIVLTSTVFLGGCGLTQSTTTPTATPTTVQSTTQAESNTITIQNFAFSPATLTVKKGTTITWTNQDSAPHQIKSNSFNSPKLATGQSFSFVFNDIGSFDYSCSIHPSMTGKIIVQ
jgi:plastocyanin